jgi:DNA-binding protein H-NS
MSEDEIRTIEKKRDHQRKLVRQRRIRAAKYNQELQDSINDYRQKNEMLRAAIEALTNEIFRLMNVTPNHVQHNLRNKVVQSNMLPRRQNKYV